MTSVFQVSLNRFQFPPRSHGGAGQIVNRVFGSRLFEPTKGADRQIKRPVKTDRANGHTSINENNIPHEFFLNLAEVQMRTNRVQDRKISVQVVKDQIQHKLRKIAEPLAAGESVKAQQNKVARKTGLSWVRVKKYWYGLVNDPPAVDFLKVASAYDSWLTEREACLSRELQELRNDLNDLS